MRTSTDATTTTRCDCEDCTGYAFTGHIQLTTPADQDHRHHQALTKNGWTDLEGRDYCPGCPPHLPVAGHDHEGLWAVDPDDTTP